MAPLSGWNARARINGNIYAIAYFEVKQTTDGVDVSNSEGVCANPAGAGTPRFGKRSKARGLRGAVVTLRDASYDPDQDPFVSPYDLAEDDYCAVKIYPSGDLDGVHHDFPNLLITELGHTGDVQGAQPVTIQGESDGDYTLSTS